ncbi:hypothetical protein Rhal01_03409 [Rubritalea halochordaticola]|uniref:Uncharacterized protein n=1 Tax=Rubritalea halochordaticola TaxID=714537 RepID=A0ABP9V3I5_9BACT
MNKDLLFEQYRKMSHTMNLLNTPSSGDPLYHLMADALYWIDEIPKHLDVDSENSLRVILRYRTSLILNEEDAQYREYWSFAKECFPQWVGFQSERCCPSKHLKEYYSNLLEC